MLNVFSVGITVSMVDHITAAMGTVIRSLNQGQLAATALNSKLNSISAGFLKGGVLTAGGMALAAPLIHASKAAEDYQHQVNRMTAAGMSHREMVESIGESWKTTNSIVTSGATENLKIISDLRSVFGSTEEAIAYMPKFAEVQGAYASVLDGRLAGKSEDLTFSAAKAIDMIGKINNRKEFDGALNSMFRVTEATLGRVTSDDYLTTYKYARQAKFGLNDEFRYKVLPELMLENKGGGGGGGSSGGVGPQLAAFYRFAVQGIMNKRAAQGLQEMGLIPESSILQTTTTGTTLKGGVVGADIAAANPMQWIKEFFVPAISKFKNIDPHDTDALVQASNQLFKGNQLATNLAAELIKKQQQYERFGKLYDKTDTPKEALERGLQNDPATAWKAFDKALENVHIAIGSTILPVLIPLVTTFATQLQSLGLVLHEQPQLAKLIVVVTGVTSGLMILGGTLLIVKAAVQGLMLAGVLFNPWGLAIAATIGVVTLAVMNWDKIMGFVRANITGIKTALHIFMAIVPGLGLAIESICYVINHWKEISEGAQKIWSEFTTAMKGAMDWIANAVNPILKLFGIAPMNSGWIDKLTSLFAPHTETDAVIDKMLAAAGGNSTAGAAKAAESPATANAGGPLHIRDWHRRMNQAPVTVNFQKDSIHIPNVAGEHPSVTTRKVMKEATDAVKKKLASSTVSAPRTQSVYLP